MGVIDLNARVKALEEGEEALGGSLDTLDASLTSLENDVDDLTKAVFTKIEPTESDTWGGFVRFEKIGNLVIAIVKITSGVPTDGAAKEYVTIPEGWEPALDIVAPSATNLGGMDGWLKASSAGKISTSKTNKSSVFGQIVWTIGATELPTE